MCKLFIQLTLWHASWGCRQPISIGKDEALYCTGRCQQWLHRYCAKEISDSKSSFQCPTCYREFSQQQIQELCGAVSDLKREFEQLKSELRTANAPSRDVPRADPSTTDPASTSTRQKSNPWKTVQVKRPNKKGPLSSQTSALQANGKSHPKRLGEHVSGVRKVWGTMKTCSTGAVAATVGQICPDIAGKIQLRRKYKTNDLGRTTRWWFVIQGDEATLTTLEEMWEGVCNQTSWRLEKCFKKIEVDNQDSQATTEPPPQPPQVNGQSDSTPISSPIPSPLSQSS